MSQSVESEDKHKCAICLNSYTQDDCQFTPCFHGFHSECIFKWLENKKICPICKNDVSVLVDAMPDSSKIERDDTSSDNEENAFVRNLSGAFISLIDHELENEAEPRRIIRAASRRMIWTEQESEELEQELEQALEQALEPAPAPEPVHEQVLEDLEDLEDLEELEDLKLAEDLATRSRPRPEPRHVFEVEHKTPPVRPVPRRTLMPKKRRWAPKQSNTQPTYKYDLSDVLNLLNNQS